MHLIPDSEAVTDHPGIAMFNRVPHQSRQLDRKALLACADTVNNWRNHDRKLGMRRELFPRIHNRQVNLPVGCGVRQRVDRARRLVVKNTIAPVRPLSVITDETGTTGVDVDGSLPALGALSDPFQNGLDRGQVVGGGGVDYDVAGGCLLHNHIFVTQ